MSDNVYTALAKAQANMGKLYKGATNPHFRSHYSTLSEVMDVVLPPCNDQGLSVWHSMPDRDTMRTTLSHGTSDTHIVCDVPLIVDKQNMQGMKSATTYAKRIGVESVCGVAPSDDDGNEASKHPPKPTPPPPKGVSPAKIATLFTEARGLGWTDEEMLVILKEKIGVSSTKELDEPKFEAFRNHLIEGDPK